VAFLHDKSITHRDIKVDNLLCLDDNSLSIKLADFGFARQYEPMAKMSLQVGSLNYMAPELLSPKVFYDHKVDVWAVGVVAYVLLAANYPFKENKVSPIRDQLVFKGDMWGNVSHYAKDFIM